METFRVMNLAKLNYVKYWGLAFHLYAEDNQDQMPETFEQAAKYFPEQGAVNRSSFDENRFEIVYRGSLRDVTKPMDTILARERQPVPNFRQPGAVKAYVFSDGHSELHSAADGVFDAWEQERIVSGRP
jgi:hypothetical protein